MVVAAMTLQAPLSCRKRNWAWAGLPGCSRAVAKALSAPSRSSGWISSKTLRPSRPAGRLPGKALVGRAQVAEGAVAVHQRDQFRGVLDERPEAPLAVPEQQLGHLALGHLGAPLQLGHGGRREVAQQRLVAGGPLPRLPVEDAQAAEPEAGGGDERRAELGDDAVGRHDGRVRHEAGGVGAGDVGDADQLAAGDGVLAWAAAQRSLARGGEGRRQAGGPGKTIRSAPARATAAMGAFSAAAAMPARRSSGADGLGA